MSDDDKAGLTGHLQAIKRFLSKEVWELELPTLSRFRALMVYHVRLLLIVSEGFLKDHCLLRASALTYYTLLSIVPMLALVFIVFKGMGGVELMEKEMRKYVGMFLAIPGEKHETTATTTPGAGPPHEDPAAGVAADRTAASADAEEAPDHPLQGDAGPPPYDPAVAADQILDTIFGSIEKIRGGAVGGLGVLFLFLSVIGMLGQIEQSFNFIWGVKKSRSVFSRVAPYWTILTFGPLLVGSSALVVTMLSSGVSKVLPALIIRRIDGFANSVLPFVTAVLMIWMAFIMLYKFMPNTQVRIRSAVIGGIAAGTLWQLTYFACQMYFTHTARAETFFKIYGALGALPLFLLWIYVNWVVVLFGAEVAFADQHVDTYRHELQAQNVSSFLKEQLAVQLAWRICEGFFSGRDPFRAGDLAKHLEVPIRLVNEVLFCMVKSGIIRETPGENPAFQPNRDLDQITVKDVLDSVRRAGDNNLSIALAEKADALQKLLDQKSAQLDGELAGLSFRSLLTKHVP